MNTTSTAKLTATLAERNITPSVRNILKVYRRATDSQMARGIEWYGEAHRLAQVLNPDNVLEAAGVIAALSPMTPWGRNCELAVRAYADGVSTGNTKSACGKANRIMAGEDVVTVLNAPKTSAFALTIADPTDPHAVVVDRHAMSVAIGRCTTDDDTKSLGLKGAYDMYADAYRRAAKIAGVAPSVMQAVTWVVWRESEIRTAAAMRREVGEE